MNGSQIIVEALRRHGVDYLFGYPGGACMPIFDALVDAPEIKIVLVRHEQGGTHMADGYARATGKPGVVLVTSGPGATNTVTGLLTAQMDSVPMVVLTGQTITPNLGKDAFQEADVFGVTMPVVKHSYLVREVNDLPRVMNEAFHLATSGRPGPVLVDLPKDVVSAECEADFTDEFHLPGYAPPARGLIEDLEKAAELISSSKKPLLYVGAGAVIAQASRQVIGLAEKLQAPVTTTLLGKGAFPETHTLSVGMLGMHGTYEANMAMHECDVLIAIGARFDDRITGKVDEFSPKSKKIHIDIDPSTINKNIVVHCPIVGDAKTVINQISNEIPMSFKPNRQDRLSWFNQIKDWENENPTIAKQKGKMIQTSYAIDLISKITNGKAVVVTDVGQHQMWVAQYYQFANPRNQITSGGLGTMGFGFPAAIGAKLGRPNDTVLAICGDGSFQMNMQEFSTAVENDLDLKIILINNGHHGMVRQWQTLFFDKNYSCCKFDLNPDYVKIAQSYGAKAFKIDSPNDLEGSFKEGLSTKGVVLMEVVVDHTEMVYPMLTPGGTMDDMLLSPDDPIPDGPVPDMS